MPFTRHDIFLPFPFAFSLLMSLRTASYCNIQPHDLSCEWEKVQGTWGCVDIQLLYVMYEMEMEGGGEGCEPCSSVWEAHKTYYRRAVKRANISVQI